MNTYVTSLLSEKHMGGVNLDDDIRKGIAASEAGDKAGAEAIFRRIVSEHPDALEAWIWLGWTSSSLDESQAAFARASTLDPNNEEAQLGLRWVSSQRSPETPAQFTPHEPSTTQAEATPSAHAPLQDGWDFQDAMRRAVGTAQAGNKPAAYAMFRQIAERHPDAPDVWVWCGGTSQSLDDAEAAFRRAQQLDPNNEEANLGLRWVALRRQAARQTAQVTDRLAAAPYTNGTGPLAASIHTTTPIAEQPQLTQEDAPQAEEAAEAEKPAKKLSPFARFLKKLNIPLPALLLASAAIVVWLVVFWYLFGPA